MVSLATKTKKSKAKPKSPPFATRMRGLQQRASDPGIRVAKNACPLVAFREMLDVTDFEQPEPVIWWEGTDDLAAFDLDFHGEYKPPRLYLETAASFGRPSPALWWLTHNGGLRAIFVRAGRITAAEQAAVFALTVRNRITSGVTGVEIKSITRHPGYPNAAGQTAGAVHRGYVPKSPDLSPLAALLGDTSAGGPEPEIIDEWLDERGMGRGQAYEHDRCPIDPGYESHAKPVFVGDHGIHCKSCESRGGALPGCRKPGFVPYAKLVEFADAGRLTNHLKNAVRGFTHYDHAKHILAAEGLSGPTAEPTYRALLKLYHLPKATGPKHAAGVEKHVGMCFFPGVPLVRGDRHWMLAEDLATPRNRDGRDAQVAGMPAVQYVTPGGKIKVDRRKVAHFIGNADLTLDGYPAIFPLTGCDLAAHLRDDGQTSARLPAVVPAAVPVRYVPKDRRDLGAAEQHFNTNFPGVNLNLIRLLVVAKAIAQTDPSEPPRIFVTGQSGAGKTQHATLAAEITGDRVHDVKFTPNAERLLQGYAAGVQRGSYVLFDEINKSIGKHKMNSADLVTSLNSMKRGASYHAMYVGNVTVPRLAVVYMTDISLPAAFRSEVQIARRVVHVDLEAGANAYNADWRTTCGPHGNNDILGWRTRSEDNRKAAEALVSEVLDSLLSYPRPFEDIAEQLGFKTIARSESEGVNPADSLRDLFRAACKVEDADKDTKFRGRGWKVFDYPGETDLATAYHDAVGDDGAGSELEGQAWGRVLGCDGVVLRVVRHGRRIGLRFRLGAERSPDVRYNEKIPVSFPASECPDPPVGTARDRLGTRVGTAA